jgi:aminoglycoside phosphotransferase (APT) family kinase protein
VSDPAAPLSPAELGLIAGLLRHAGTEPRGPLTASLIAGGKSNLTFRLTDGAAAWVLRTPPRMGRTPSAPDVAREFRVTSALPGTSVPVAHAIAPVVHVDDQNRVVDLAARGDS